MGFLHEDAFKNRIFPDDMQAPGGILVYFADGDEEIVYANKYVLNMFECDTAEEFLEHTNGSFRDFVYGEDIDAVEDSIWEQVGKHHGFDRICYRIKTRSGALKSVEDFGRLVESEEDRPVFYVFVSELGQQGPVDWLTGLPSMDRFYKLALADATALQECGKHPVAVAFNLMGMKQYNANNGREKGDALLCSFATVLRKHFGTDACSRYADDRFLAFSVEDQATQKIEAVFVDFREQNGNDALPVRAGAYLCSEDDDIVAVGFDRSMIACDSDRTSWLSHVEWFNDVMMTSEEQRSYVLKNLDRCIQNGFVRPYYQAIVRSATGDVCCEEALARWNDPEYGSLSPAQFIPILEEAGLLHKLDMHMIDCVLEDFKVKMEQGVPLVPVSVNISLKDMRKVDLAAVVSAKVLASDVSHDMLRIEFTESAASDDPELFKAQVEALHEAGFRVWMDDFGSGYSSLNSLKDFDFDLVKLDMEFIRGGNSEKARSIVAGIVGMSRALGVDTLAEGVETEQQEQFLKSIGCSRLQGYRYSRPQPLDVVIGHYRQGRTRNRETSNEADYWNTISIFDLSDPVRGVDAKGVAGELLSELPAGIVECRAGCWRLVRANKPFRDFLVQSGLLEEESGNGVFPAVDRPLGLDFHAAAQRSVVSGNWERITGRFEYDTGLRFYASMLAAEGDAQAFAVASAPAILGVALGQYGDVPVAYAVFRLVYDEAQEHVVNLEYIYANPVYVKWGNFEQGKLAGHFVHDVYGKVEGDVYENFYRAAVHNEMQRKVAFDPLLDKWISYCIAPSPLEGCCVFAYMVLDEIPREAQS